MKRVRPSYFQKTKKILCSSVTPRILDPPGKTLYWISYVNYSVGLKIQLFTFLAHFGATVTQTADYYYKICCHEVLQINVDHVNFLCCDVYRSCLRNSFWDAPGSLNLGLWTVAMDCSVFRYFLGFWGINWSSLLNFCSPTLSICSNIVFVSINDYICPLMSL